LKNASNYFQEFGLSEVEVTNTQIYLNTVSEFSQKFYSKDCMNETEEECCLSDFDCPHEILHDIFQR
jgi:hypothetical protein